MLAPAGLGVGIPPSATVCYQTPPCAPAASPPVHVLLLLLTALLVGAAARARGEDAGSVAWADWLDDAKVWQAADTPAEPERLPAPEPSVAFQVLEPTMRPLLDRIVAGQIDPTFVISHRLTLEDAPDAYATFRAKQDSCTKVVMRP